MGAEAWDVEATGGLVAGDFRLEMTVATPPPTRAPAANIAARTTAEPDILARDDTLEYVGR